MAGRHPKSMRPRDERAHPLVRDAIARGYLGSGKWYYVTGFPTQEAASDCRRSVHCAGRHLGPSVEAKDATDVQELSDGTWRLKFRLWPKDHGRKHVMTAYGDNPPYNPFQRAEGPIVDDSGSLIR